MSNKPPDVGHLLNMILDLTERVAALEAQFGDHDNRIDSLENPYKGVSRLRSLERGFESCASARAERKAR